MSKNPYKKKRKKPGAKKSRSADKKMQETSTQDIINTMNYLLSILNARGIKIVNWDNNHQELGGIKMFKQKPYFLVGIDESKEVEK